MKKNKKITDKDFENMQKIENNRQKYIKRGFYLSYSTRIILMFATVIVLGILSYQCFNVSFTESHDTTLLYEENSKVDYNIGLLPGNPYETGELIPSEYYISDAISTISTDFKYDIALSEKADITYSYSVEAETEIINKDNGNVLSNRKDTLIPKVEKTINDNSDINILQNINLDYKTYNDNARLVNNNYSINAEGQIVVKMLINMTIKYDGFEKPITKTQELKATIPLLASEVKVALDNPINNKDLYSEHSKTELKSKVTLYLGIALLIIDVIFTLLVFSFIFRAKPKKSKYCTLRDGLLRDYGDIIVNSRSIPSFNGTNIIDCYSFSELMDAQKLLKKPIVYCEIVKNQKALFMIINGDDAYKFTLKEADLDY